MADARHGARTDWAVLICELWLLWVLLWGSLSAVVLVSGVLVAVVTTLVCPVPSAGLATLRPYWVLVLVVRTSVQLLRASVSVSWAALRHGSHTRSAVIAVPLRRETDRLVRGAVQLTGLSPGSMVLEIDREHSVLYVHSLPVPDGASAERHRRQILDSEDDILRTFRETGSHRSAADTGSDTGSDTDTGGTGP